MEQAADLIRQLQHRDWRRRADAAWELGQIGDPVAVLPLCEALKEWSQWEDDRERVRKAAAEALVEFGEPAVLPLCEVLKTGGVGAREWAIEALGRIGDPRAVQPLEAAFRDERLWDGRRKAAEALGRMGTAAVEPLCDALSDSRSGVRCMATATLNRIGDRRAVPALCAALGDEHWSVRCLAATALGTIGGREAVAPLCQALEAGGPDLRQHAASALGRIGDHRAVLPLFAAREDGNASVRAKVAEALSRIVLCGPAAEALVRMGTAAVLPLCEVLKDVNADARCHAATLLVRIAEQEPAPALRAAAAPLRRLLSPWRLGDVAEAQVYRSAPQRIEAATAAMDLPLPATAPPLSPETLPIPATPAPPDPDRLPVPSCDPILSPDALHSQPSALHRAEQLLGTLWRWVRGDPRGGRRSSDRS